MKHGRGHLALPMEGPFQLATLIWTLLPWVETRSRHVAPALSMVVQETKEGEVNVPISSQ